MGKELRNWTLAALLIITALAGISILLLDKLIWQIAAYERAIPLIAIVVVDLALAGLVFVRGGPLMAVFAWSIIRLALQFGDILTAPQWYPGTEPSVAYRLFASYLLNPLDRQGVKFGNPPGIPAIAIDIMVICYIALAALSVKRPRP